MRELFIYYRTSPFNAEALREKALDLQARLRTRHTGLEARLLLRPEAKDGLMTWMETYAMRQSPEGVPEAVQNEIEMVAGMVLGPLIEGPRHTEVFNACAS
jgi:hypothetical protein